MEDKKIVIWILGGNGSGKTTQCKNLINKLNESINGDTKPGSVHVTSGKTLGKLTYCYTKFRRSGVAFLGKMGENQCTGLDSVYSDMGAQGVVNSLKLALNDKEVKIIFIECVFGTFSWYERWVKTGLRKQFKLLFIHLELDLFNNYRRIQQRRAKKLGTQDWMNIHLADTVYKNVGNKNRETRVIYQKLAGEHPKSKVKLADAICQVPAIYDEKIVFESLFEFVKNSI